MARRWSWRWPGGKQAHDKRQDLARRDAQREVVRELGRRAKGMS